MVGVCVYVQQAHVLSWLYQKPFRRYRLYKLQRCVNTKHVFVGFFIPVSYIPLGLGLPDSMHISSDDQSDSLATHQTTTKHLNLSRWRWRERFFRIKNLGVSICFSCPLKKDVQGLFKWLQNAIVRMLYQPSAVISSRSSH